LSGNSEKPQPKPVIDESAYYRALEREVNRAMAEDMQIGFRNDSVGEMICAGGLAFVFLMAGIGVLFGVGLIVGIIMGLLSLL